MHVIKKENLRSGNKYTIDSKNTIMMILFA